MTFRFKPPGLNADALDALNTAIERRMLKEDVAAPLMTRLDGEVVLRACTIAPGATTDEIRSMVANFDERARTAATGTNLDVQLAPRQEVSMPNVP